MKIKTRFVRTFKSFSWDLWIIFTSLQLYLTSNVLSMIDPKHTWIWGLEIITPNHFLSSLTNPKLTLRLEDLNLDSTDLPTRKLVLRSLGERDELMEIFRQLWYEDYLLSLREKEEEFLRNSTVYIHLGEVVVVKIPGKSRPSGHSEESSTPYVEITVWWDQLGSNEKMDLAGLLNQTPVPTGAGRRRLYGANRIIGAISWRLTGRKCNWEGVQCFSGQPSCAGYDRWCTRIFLSSVGTMEDSCFDSMDVMIDIIANASALNTFHRKETPSFVFVKGTQISLHDLDRLDRLLNSLWFPSLVKKKYHLIRSPIPFFAVMGGEKSILLVPSSAIHFYNSDWQVGSTGLICSISQEDTTVHFTA